MAKDIFLAFFYNNPKIITIAGSIMMVLDIVVKKIGIQQEATLDLFIIETLEPGGRWILCFA